MDVIRGRVDVMGVIGNGESSPAHVPAVARQSSGAPRSGVDQKDMADFARSQYMPAVRAGLGVMKHQNALALLRASNPCVQRRAQRVRCNALLGGYCYLLACA